MPYDNSKAKAVLTATVVRHRAFLYATVRYIGVCLGTAGWDHPAAGILNKSLETGQFVNVQSKFYTNNPDPSI